MAVSARTDRLVTMPNGEPCKLRLYSQPDPCPCHVCGNAITFHIYRPDISWRCEECVGKYGKDILPLA